MGPPLSASNDRGPSSTPDEEEEVTAVLTKLGFPSCVCDSETAQQAINAWPTSSEPTIDEFVAHWWVTVMQSVQGPVLFGADMVPQEFSAQDADACHDPVLQSHLRTVAACRLASTPEQHWKAVKKLGGDHGVAHLQSLSYADPFLPTCSPSRITALYHIMTPEGELPPIARHVSILDRALWAAIDLMETAREVLRFEGMTTENLLPMKRSQTQSDTSTVASKTSNPAPDQGETSSGGRADATATNRREADSTSTVAKQRLPAAVKSMPVGKRGKDDSAGPEHTPKKRRTTVAAAKVDAVIEELYRTPTAAERMAQLKRLTNGLYGAPSPLKSEHKEAQSVDSPAAQPNQHGAPSVSLATHHRAVDRAAEPKSQPATVDAAWLAATKELKDAWEAETQQVLPRLGTGAQDMFIDAVNAAARLTACIYPDKPDVAFEALCQLRTSLGWSPTCSHVSSSAHSDVFRTYVQHLTTAHMATSMLEDVDDVGEMYRPVWNIIKNLRIFH